jgi:uncharacterized membrane protein
MMDSIVLTAYRRLCGSYSRTLIFLLSLAPILFWLFGLSSLFRHAAADHLVWPLCLSLLCGLGALFIGTGSLMKNSNGQGPEKLEVRLAIWRYIERIVRWCDGHPKSLCALCGGWLFATCFILGLRRYCGLAAGAFDLGIFDQVVFNVADGAGFFSSLKDDSSYLADHFSPILGALAPLYRLWPSPVVLLCVQSSVLALAVIPLYSATARMASKRTAVILVALYVASVPVRRLATYDFHPECFAPLVLLMALDRLQAKKTARALLWLLAALTIKESTILGVAGVGLAVFFGMRRRILGSAVFCIALAHFVTTIVWIIPSFGSGAGFSYVTSRYGALGSTVGEVVTTLVARPYLAYHLFWPGPKIEYLMRLLIPLALMPLIGWRYTIGALFIWAQNTLTDYHPMHSVHFHYTAEIIPFLWLGAADGAARIKGSFMALSRPKLYPALLGCAALLTLLLSEAPELALAWRIKVTDREERIAHVLAALPANASVSAEFNLVPLLSRRRHIYLFPCDKKALAVDFIALDGRNKPRPWNTASKEKDAATSYREAVNGLPAKGYGLIATFEGFSLWARGRPHE